MHFLQSGVFIAIIAHFLIGLSLLWDKIILKQTNTASVVNFVFWMGAISIFGCIVGVFGMELPSVGMFLIALAAGALDLVATYFYYKALKSGEASQTLAVMGGFTPLATALLSIPLLKNKVFHGSIIWGFALMVAGGFFMFFSERINVRKLLPLVVMSAGCFGLSNVLQRMAFNAMGFPTGFVFFSIGSFLCAACLLVRKKWRDEIFTSSEKAQPRSKIAYFVNRFLAGVGAFLVAFAISRAHPAVVAAIAGVRYATIFVGAYLLTQFKPQWLKEVYTGWTLTAKTIATGLVIAGLAITGAGGRNSGASTTARIVRPGETHWVKLQGRLRHNTFFSSRIICYRFPVHEICQAPTIIRARRNPAPTGRLIMKTGLSI